MMHLELPDEHVRPLPFYLAVEEWAARRLPAGDYFFIWRVAPTVICGRNQDIALEVDIDYCRREGISLCQRKSGGGCVFADMQNWMFSYITPGDAIRTTFADYTAMIARTLRTLGIDAEPSGSNDIEVGGRKISGNAFYHLPGRCIVHGTMLYDLDTRHLAHALTPSRAKLARKGVASVPQRVTSLRALGLEMSTEDFGAYVLRHLTDGSRRITPEEIAEIEEIQKSYFYEDNTKNTITLD